MTVPVPFSFEHRIKRPSEAERRYKLELEEEQKALDVAKKQNKSRDLPATTAPGLYSEMVAEAEAQSRDRRRQRKTVPVPFSFTQRESRNAQRASDLARAAQMSADAMPGEASAQAWAEERGVAPAVGERKSFRARDVPRSMSEPRWEMMRVQDAERRERCAQEALKSAQKSKLPARMQQHNETYRARKAAEAERIQAELDAELTLTPAITQNVPDFDRLHTAFERNLARKRQSHKQTQPKPFKMESEPYRLMQREVKQVRDEMIQRDMRRDELVMPERRWPYLSTQAPIGRKPMPDFHKEHESWKARVPSESTTEKHEAQIEKLRLEREESKKKDAAKVKAENDRQSAQRNVTLKVANRLKEIAGDPRQIARKDQEEAVRRKEEHRQAWKERKKAVDENMAEMRARVDARPFLFEQASIDTAVERAKMEAHDRFDATMRKAGLADRLDMP